MSRSRRDFLRLAGGGALATGLLSPKEALACCFGPRRVAPRMRPYSGPDIWISNPTNGMELARTFTAYGDYTLGQYGRLDITARLYKTDDDDYKSSDVTWTTSDPFSV